MCAINVNHMMYGFSLNEMLSEWDAEFLPEWSKKDTIFCHFGRLTDIIFIFHFGLFFGLLSLLMTKKNNIKKVKKNCRYYYFTHVHHKWQSYLQFRIYGARWREKWHIEVSAPPKNTRTWMFSNNILYNTLNADTFADNTGLKNCLRRTVQICEIACLWNFLYLN